MRTLLLFVLTSSVALAQTEAPAPAAADDVVEVDRVDEDGRIHLTRILVPGRAHHPDLAVLLTRESTRTDAVESGLDESLAARIAPTVERTPF